MHSTRPLRHWLTAIGLATLVALPALPAVAQGRGGCPQPCPNAVATAPMGKLSDAQKDGLRFMREEEKLARDVYRALGKKWKHPTFNNIAKAEQRHMDMMGVLLERYGLEDPIGKNAPGVFDNPELQRLHDALVADGLRSLPDALRVGALVEETDLDDLHDQIADKPPADVAQVYENLARGSRNHLRAFVRALEASGADYAPKVLDAKTFDVIVAGGMERGRGAGGGGRGWRQGGR